MGGGKGLGGGGVEPNFGGLGECNIGLSHGGGDCWLSGGEGGRAGVGCTAGTTGRVLMQWIPCWVTGSANTAVQGAPVMIPRNAWGFRQ